MKKTMYKVLSEIADNFLEQFISGLKAQLKLDRPALNRPKELDAERSQFSVPFLLHYPG